MQGPLNGGRSPISFSIFFAGNSVFLNWDPTPIQLCHWPRSLGTNETALSRQIQAQRNIPVKLIQRGLRQRILAPGYEAGWRQGGGTSAAG